MISKIPQNIALKCPYCGWSTELNTASLKRIANTDIAKGLGDPFLKIIDKVHQAIEHGDDIHFFWVDIPKCPNCSSSFQVNIVSGEIRK